LAGTFYLDALDYAEFRAGACAHALDCGDAAKAQRAFCKNLPVRCAATRNLSCRMCQNRARKN
jgi:hypothetical protein